MSIGDIYSGRLTNSNNDILTKEQISRGTGEVRLQPEKFTPCVNITFIRIGPKHKMLALGPTGIMPPEALVAPE